MRIALDCRSVFRGMGGIGRYALSLVRALGEIDSNNEYICYFTHLPPPAPLSLPRNFRIRIFEAGMIDERFDQLVLPTVLEDDRIDLYHNPTFSVPVVRAGARIVATVHDVVFKRRPELVEPRLRAFLDDATRRACRVADRIVTVSEFSRKELVELYEVEESCVEAIHNGIEPPPPAAHESAAERARAFGLSPGRFVLYVGSIEPKKNIDVLLVAFREVSVRLHDPALRLALVGSQGTGYSVEERIRETGLSGRVVVTGYVSTDDLEALYRSAAVFVYPSLYEGFGFPPLEAMARGVPTIVSDAASLPEVVGESARRFDPSQPATLADELVGLLGDEGRRAELVRRGYARAGAFTWAKSAQKHLQLFQQVSHEDRALRV